MIPVKIKFIPFYDTLGHFILYGITAYLAHRALERKIVSYLGLNIPLGSLIISCFALVEESLQLLSPYRTFSLLDLTANLCGIILFYWIDRKVPPWSEMNLLSVIVRFTKLVFKFTMAAIFALVVFLTLGITKGWEFHYISRYDSLFLFFILFQVLLIMLKYESKKDLHIILSFHMLGLFMELYKVHFGGWSYPETAYLKFGGVPLYSGFMYGSVAGFLLQLWKRLKISLSRWPSSSIVAIIGLVTYLNFFSMDISIEFRSFLIFLVVFVFAKSKIEYTNTTKKRSVPIVFIFSGLGIFVWIAENIATYLGAWAYPYQLSHWQMVHLSKINSWFLLGVVCFILVVELIKKGGTASNS
jgi:uncharacterized membrane protein YoaT (DUF817 family)